MTEYGVFTTEDCVEDQLRSLDEAEEVRQQHLGDDSDADPTDNVVKEMCPEHQDSEQAKGECGECLAEHLAQCPDCCAEIRPIGREAEDHHPQCPRRDPRF
ncbi:hypothetical protein ABZ419_11380 [Streptomyces cinnamoneus]|uniref:hypothetical protein n=1 Tax=Streptomyces cinnamoneus TaxID=53446 RepID=UPI0033C033ED